MARNLGLRSERGTNKEHVDGEQGLTRITLGLFFTNKDEMLENNRRSLHPN